MKTLLSLFIVALFAMSPAFAKKRRKAGMNPRGTDGCGIGWKINKNKTLLGTSVRGTTNAFVPPTFGMTTGTLGCDQHGIASKDVPSANYIATNIDQIKHEMAIGSGEALFALSQLMGCADKDQFAGQLKKNYGKIVSGPNVSGIEVFKNIKTTVQGKCRT